MNEVLQPLFQDPILQVISLDPGYEDRGSDVWLVETPSEKAVVRASRRPRSAEQLNDFWWGCYHLFGTTPWEVYDLEGINEKLGRIGAFRVPQVLRKGVCDQRELVVVEWLPGALLSSFTELSYEALVDFGRRMALVHRRAFAYCGHLLRKAVHPLEEFHPRAAETMRELVRRFHGHDGEIRRSLDAMCDAMSALPPPAAGSPVLVDMDPTQFLVDGGEVSALIDTEACVVGPRELDFIALEYCLDEAGAAAFAKGYREVSPLPDLERVRAPYRFLYRLLAVQGHEPLEQWMSHPCFFGRGAACAI